MKRIVVISLILLFTAAPSFSISQTTPETPDEIRVLSLLTTSFGWNFFDTRDRLESYGVDVDIVGYALDYEIPSCVNRAPRPVTADYLLSEMTPEIRSDYHCLFIPAGGHWNALSQSQTVLDFVEEAYEAGLVIATMCIGQRVIAAANGIISGSKIAFFGFAWQQVTDAGGIPALDGRVVSHNRFVTGGAGGGFYPGDGYVSAPAYMVAAEIIRECLGLSRIEEVTLNPIGDGLDDFTLAVTPADLADAIPVLNSTEIGEVSATIYPTANHNDTTTIELFDDDVDGTWTADIVGLEDGDYLVDIGLLDTEDVLDVETQVTSFTVQSSTSTTTSTTSTTTTTTTTTEDLPMILIGGSIAILAVVAVVAVVALKRR